MKKNLIAIAGLASLGLFSHIASAQNAVTVYGVMDLGMSVDQGGINGASTRLTSGMATQSRWGVRGTEDLGQGNSAFFVLEGGLHADTGGSTQNGNLFGRTSIVGLSNALGTISLGLQDTPFFTTLNTVVDPLRNGIARSNNLMATTGFRAGNSILLRSANFNGYSADLMYAAGEVAGDINASRAIDGSFGYSQGPLNVRMAYHVKNNDTANVKNTDTARNFLIAANYDFGSAKVYAGYGVDKGPNSAALNNSAASFGGAAPTASTDSTDLLLGVSVPFGANTVVATYVRKDDKTALNQDAQQYALAYMYAFSKRTDIYTSYAVIRNHNGAAYTEGNSEEPGLGNKQFTVGLRHRF
ncbi:porin [Undibacterium sp. Jales W-56]|uniref:porin n=1 Tax=Undibacterium sp. Jales W-56 TaxID=2897325 RepID=UPI0021D3239F|nr:porin [Undibacterium sp. Jales W-56]MCU6433152.1 porin [Undibacterium sp. Jales W-56]